MNNTSCIKAMHFISNSTACDEATLGVLVWLASTFTRLAEKEELMTLDQVILLFDIAAKCFVGSINDRLVSDSLYCMSYSLSSGNEEYL